jgi:hypothetical protein
MIAGLNAKSINSVMQWIVSGLWGGYTAPNFLKWYWWRFNGYGYFWGMIVGILAALVFPLLFPSLSPLNSFPFILVLSGIACIIASLKSDPEDDETLTKFYTSVRPWGFWKPVHEAVLKANPSFVGNRAFKRDMVNIVVGIIWQMTLVVIPVYFVIEKFKFMWISMLILIITSLFLKRNWYNKLEDD